MVESPEKYQKVQIVRILAVLLLCGCAYGQAPSLSLASGTAVQGSSPSLNLSERGEWRARSASVDAHLSSGFCHFTHGCRRLGSDGCRRHPQLQLRFRNHDLRGFRTECYGNQQRSGGGCHRNTFSDQHGLSGFVTYEQRDGIIAQRYRCGHDGDREA